MHLRHFVHQRYHFFERVRWLWLRNTTETATFTSSQLNRYTAFYLRFRAFRTRKNRMKCIQSQSQLIRHYTLFRRWMPLIPLLNHFQSSPKHQLSLIIPLYTTETQHHLCMQINASFCVTNDIRSHFFTRAHPARIHRHFDQFFTRLEKSHTSW